MGTRMTEEDGRLICLASLSVINMIITVNAASSPVHLLQPILVTLKLAKRTSRTSARPMPRVFEDKFTLDKRLDACRGYEPTSGA